MERGLDICSKNSADHAGGPGKAGPTAWLLIGVKNHVPRVEILSDFHIQAVKGQETDVVKDEDGDESLEVAEVWTLVLTDRQSRDQIRIAFRREARDELVRQLTSGVVLAGGEFPKV